MSDLDKAKEILKKAEALLEKAYSNAGPVSIKGTDSSFSGQLDTPSAEVMLTEGKKKKKFITDQTLEKVAPTPKVKVEGITTAVDGKKLKITGLSDKEKDEYLFGKPDPRQKMAKINESADELIELLSAYNAPEVDFEEDLVKCDAKGSKLIKEKKGVWRRVGGRPCFICKDGVIHAGPKPFVGKKVSNLKSELKAERKKAKKAKK
jgi:hypothetical protein